MARKKNKGGCGCSGASAMPSEYKGGSNFGAASINIGNVGINNTIPNYSVNTYNNDPLHMSISSRNLPNTLVSGGKRRKTVRRKTLKKRKTLKRRKTNIRYIKRKKYGGKFMLSALTPIPTLGLFGPNQIDSSPNVQPITKITDSNPALI